MGRIETLGKTTGTKERGVGETGAKDTGVKENRVKAMGLRETDESVGAQVSYDT